eukprot:363865-Chlamydomonas_euryale.AAC.2
MHLRLVGWVGVGHIGRRERHVVMRLAAEGERRAGRVGRQHSPVLVHAARALAVQRQRPRPPRRQWPLHLHTAHEPPKQDVRVQPGRVRRRAAAAADVGACCTAAARLRLARWPEDERP